MRISDWSSDVCSSDLHVQRLLRARQGAARRSLDQREHCTLVFRGEEAAGQTHEDQTHGRHDHQIDEARALPTVGGATHAALVLAGTTIELVVEPAEEAGERAVPRSEEHTSELQSLMRISYAVF